MAANLNHVDPAWAWSPYSGEAPRWGRSAAAHLLRRAGFGFTPGELTAVVAQGPIEAVHGQVATRSETAAFGREIDSLARSVLAASNVEALASWWAYRLMHSPDQLREKMTLFWHGHFATSAEKVDDADAMFAQNQLLREHALGDFAALTHAVARDPAMLVYLDSATNRKSHPNENFARELMELFCLGEGNYTERDVQQLARCFTGWEIKRGAYRFNRYQHDSGEKQILGQAGSFGGDEGIDLVLAQAAAPQFIARKLFAFFVCDEPQPTAELLEPLTRALREHDFQIAPVVERILASNLFYSPHAMGRKIRSPAELIVGLMRCLEGTTNANALAAGLRELGQGLFYPPNVKGWDGGRAWINSATLLGRANLVRRLLSDPTTRFDGGDLETLLRNRGARQAGEIVGHLAEMLLAMPLAEAVAAELADVVEHGSGSRSERIAAVIYAMSSLPEFHLG